MISPSLSPLDFPRIVFIFHIFFSQLHCVAPQHKTFNYARRRLERVPNLLIKIKVNHMAVGVWLRMAADLTAACSYLCGASYF